MKTKKTIEQRFEAKVERIPESGCWIWTASINRGGYGTMGYGKKSMLAHRFSYERFVGRIPDGLQLDHLCRNRCCVNPAHLEAVTPRTNVLRSEGVTKKNAFKTHCKHGHEFTVENIIPLLGGGGRRCKECERLRCERRRANATPEQKAHQAAYQRARYLRMKANGTAPR